MVQVAAMRYLITVAVAGLVLLPSTLLAQTSKSATFAAELTKLLDEHKLDSIAARQGGDQFVSALYYPGSQLLVVGGKYSSPDRLTYLILQKNFKDAYADLSSASEQSSKLFVMDLGANGLSFKRENNNLDTADIAGKSVSFDGEWKKAKLSETEYRQAFETADSGYSQMLQTLITALKK
jgi:hypothetical protein